MSTVIPINSFGLILPESDDMPPVDVVEGAILDDLPFWFDKKSVKRLPKKETMRATRSITYGKEGLEGIIKWDMTPPSRHGALTYEHGNNTLNDILTLIRGPNRERFYLSGLLHSGKVEVEGKDIVYSVEPKYEGMDLYRRAKQGRIDPKHYMSLFGKVITGVRHYTESEGIFHRDLTAHNIIVNNDEPVIIDWTLACKKEDAEPHNQPTAGKRGFTDPLLYTKFTGKEKAYDIGSELWSLGVDMLVADLGRDIYKLDYETGEFCALDKDGNKSRSLLNKEGKLDVEAWDEYRASLIKEMQPKVRRKLGRVIERLTSLDEKERYRDAADLQWNYERETRSFFSWHNPFMQTAAVIGTAGVVALSVFTTKTYNEKRNLEDKIHQELLTTDATSDYVQSLNNIETGIADLDVTINGKHYFRELGSGGVPGIQAKPGDVLDVLLTGITKPVKDKDNSTFDTNSIGTLPAEIRLEGYESKEAHFYPNGPSSRQPDLSGEAGMAGPWPTYYTIPQDIKPGVYRLLVDIYPYSEEPAYGNHVKIRFHDTKHALIRKAIPIIVGDIPEDQRIVVDGAGTSGFAQQFSLLFKPVTDEAYRNIRDSITYDIYVPEEHWKNSVTESYSRTSNDVALGIPFYPQRVVRYKQEESGKNVEVPEDSIIAYSGFPGKGPVLRSARPIDPRPAEVKKLIFAVARHGDQFLGYTCVPLQQRNRSWSPGNEYRDWAVELPTHETEERCVQYRKMLLKDSR